jgi:hypothetical protein
LTGREPPTEPVREAWLVFGRRSGKDIKAASIAVYLATIGAEAYGWHRFLTRGERGVVQILAVDRDQATIAFRYCRAFFDQPMLAKLLKREIADTLELTNGLAIEITTNDQRRVRGRTVIAAILDEVAHWKSENTQSPDIDVYRALSPAMATIPNALLIGISSPYARKGLLWEKHNKHWAQSGNILVARAPTWVMNPNLAKESGKLAEDFADDPAWAEAEYGAEWRTDVESFVRMEVLDACIDVAEAERPRDPDGSYFAFCDPSGGSSDSFTLAIAHQEQALGVLDVIREAPAPFSPSEVVGEFSALLRSYGISRVVGDRYAGNWPREAFGLYGITYEPSEFNKSEIYLDVLPMLNGRTVALLDHDVMRRQFLALERKTARGGRDSVDHPRGLKDDVANAVAGVLTLALHAPGATTVPGFNRKLEYLAMGVV